MTLEDLKANVKALQWGNKTEYQALKELVEGGSFLCYHSDVKDFLNTLDINPKNKEYSDDESWTLYINLLAMNGEKLLKL
jgi:hypothetical protein